MFARRIGLFVVILGLIIVLVAINTGKPNSQNLTLFCIGVPLIILGGALWFRNRERASAERFRLLRKYSSQSEEEEE